VKFNSPQINFVLPKWITDFDYTKELIYPTLEDRMNLVIQLARINAQPGRGGPFAAAVFELETGKLISPGVNLVVQENNSALHAEVVALMMAQKSLKSYSFSLNGSGNFQIATSTEPCAMCMGAIPWSGVRELVCGSRDEDARAIGFEEGLKPAAWIKWYEENGIKVIRDILRAEATEVLKGYLVSGGVIYNGADGND